MESHSHHTRSEYHTSQEYVKKEMTAGPRRQHHGMLEFVPTSVPTLDDFKKKLDGEHENVSGRLQEGARARHELQAIRGKLADELDEHRTALDIDIEKVDAKLGAINKMHHNENEHGMYLELRTEEIKGHLDGNEKNRAKFNELQKRLDHELAEVDKRLKEELEASKSMHDVRTRLENDLQIAKAKYAAGSLRLKASIKAEDQIVTGLKDYVTRLHSENEYLKRKFVIESKFQSKQDAFKDKLMQELDEVMQKLAQERAGRDHLEGHKKRAEELLRDTTEKIGYDLQTKVVQLDAESKVKDKLKQYAAKLTEQLDYIQGSLNATTDVRVTLQSHLETLESKHKDAAANLMASSSTVAELETMKRQREREIETASDEYQTELDDINTKLEVSNQFISVLTRYLERIELDREIVKEKLEVETYGRLELEELEKRLEDESIEVMGRIEGENRIRAQLDARKLELDQDRQSRVNRARQELTVLNEKLEAALEVKAEMASRLKDVEGELEYVRSKQDMGVEMRAEMEVTQIRFKEVLQEVDDEVAVMNGTILELQKEKARFEEELETVRAKVEAELEDLVMRLSVQAKRIYGLEGLERKLHADLAFVKRKLDSIIRVRAELEQYMKRLMAVIDALEKKNSEEEKAVVVMRDDEKRLNHAWNKDREALDRELESLQVKIEAEHKMRLGVQEFKKKLTEEMHAVQLKIKIENCAHTTMTGYKDKLKAEQEAFDRKAQMAAKDIATLEQQKKHLLDEMQDLKMKIGGELDHITERLENDTRNNYTLEGYRRKLGDEIFLVKRRLGLNN